MQSLDRMDRLNLGLIAAGIGFFGMLAIFPALAATVMIWSMIADPAQIETYLALAEDVMPPEVFRILSDQVRGLMGSADGTTLGWASLLSLGVALWSARAGVAALIRGLNAAYGADHREGMLRRIASAVGLTLLLCGVGIVAIASVVIAPIVISFLPLGPLAAAAAEAARWVVAFGVIIVALALIYRYGPNRSSAQPRSITPGAVAAAVLWLVVSVAFSVYLANFARYNEIYGSLGAAVAMLMWFYLSAYVVLLGGVLNAELDPDFRALRRGRDDVAAAGEEPAD